MRKKQKARLVKRRTPQVIKYAEHHDLSFYDLNGSTTRYLITNRSSRVLRISELHITWPTATCEGLFNIFLGGEMIWSGFDAASPTDITSGWSGTPDKRDVDKGNSYVEFFWGTGTDTGFTLEIVFENGQSVYVEH